ncbi:MAG: glucose-1-phosphate thymidylyltransferase, partial [Chlamydiota bacterium]
NDKKMGYLKKGNLTVKLLGRGFAWLDMGTHDSLQKASSFVQTIEERQGIKIACVEEIAYHLGYIDHNALSNLSKLYGQSDYAKYLQQLSIS